MKETKSKGGDCNMKTDEYFEKDCEETSYIEVSLWILKSSNWILLEIPGEGNLIKYSTPKLKWNMGLKSVWH